MNNLEEKLLSVADNLDEKYFLPQNDKYVYPKARLLSDFKRWSAALNFWASKPTTADIWPIYSL